MPETINQKWLELLKVYLPYVAITVLFYMCKNLYNDNVMLHNARLADAKNERDFWHKAYLETTRIQKMRYEKKINNSDFFDDN